MGLLNRILKRGGEPPKSAVEEISKCYKTAEITPEDCEGCSLSYPKSMSIDTDTPLFDSAPKPAAQILVATGQHNWKHDITEEPEAWGRVCKALADGSDKIGAAAGGKVRVNGTNLEYDDVPDGRVVVIVLPQFLRLETTPETAVTDVLKALAVKDTASAASVAPAVPLTDKGFILVCSHAQRDKRCGITAPILKKELDIELRQVGLYRDPMDDEPGGVRVVFCNHVGGHKFAANCFVYLNNGEVVLMGRVKPQHARIIVENTIEKGIVYPELVRNCTKWSPYEW